MLGFLQYKNTYLEQLVAVYDKDHACTVLGWLCEKVTGKSLTFLMVTPSAFNEQHEKQIAEWVDKIVSEHHPLQYILETISFGPLTLRVEEPVLIPRPETEEWIYNVLHSLKSYKYESLSILDLCTGSGCIALAAAHYFKNAHMDAVDLYEKPLELTSKNARLNECNNVQVIQSDLFSELVGKQYDIILSNPPYIDEKVWQTLSPTVKNWEDKNALVADNTGLALYEQIIQDAPRFLKKDSVLKNVAQIYLEIGYDQGTTVTQLLQHAGFASVTVHKDFAGHDRMISALL